MKDSGERQQFTTGAVRDTAAGKPRPDLISPHANLREGNWLRLGAEKYKERNWEAGIPISRCIASLARHLESYKLGLRDEDHMAAIRCNAGFILHYEEEIKAGRLDAGLDDMPHYLDRGVTTPLVPGVSLERVPPTMTLGVDLASGPGETIEHIRYVCPRCGRAKSLVERAPCTDCLVPVSPQAPFTVYLCGPITGQEVDYTWRAAATAMLQAHGICTLNPLRGKHRDQISDLGLGYRGQLAAPEIADRDDMDIHEADAILAHFPYDPPRQSIGSFMEIGGAAIGLKKPVVLCTEVRVINEHLFCRNFCILEKDFEQALRRIVAMAEVKRR
jgi:nucleoside 2-deoxyribosyltransferase